MKVERACEGGLTSGSVPVIPGKDRTSFFAVLSISPPLPLSTLPPSQYHKSDPANQGIYLTEGGYGHKEQHKVYLKGDHMHHSCFWKNPYYMFLSWDTLIVTFALINTCILLTGFPIIVFWKDLFHQFLVKLKANLYYF